MANEPKFMVSYKYEPRIGDRWPQITDEKGVFVVAERCVYGPMIKPEHALIERIDCYWRIKKLK